MNNLLISYDPHFIKELKKLPSFIIYQAAAKEKLFKTNPLHPSLRIHKLKGKLNGLWSLSINKKYRIIFEPQNDGVILFISVGKHNIYRYL